jgi:hypothetical protein
VDRKFAEYSLAKRTSRVDDARFRLWHCDFAVYLVQLFCNRAIQAIQSTGQMGELHIWRAPLHNSQPRGEVDSRLASVLRLTRLLIRDREDRADV